MSEEVVKVANSDEIEIIIRTADQTRKAEVAVPSDSPCKDLIDGAIENWDLDDSVDYTLANTTQNLAIDPDVTIGGSGIRAGDVLEVQAVLVAGNEC